MAPPYATQKSSKLENVLNFFPQGHEKPLKHALYNVAAIIFILLGAFGVAIVYFILGPFLRPLLWAVLCGSVLHPFKRNLTSTVREWLNSLKATGTPLSIGLIAFPVGIIDQTAEKLGQLIVHYAKALLIVTLMMIISILIYVLTPGWFLKILLFFKTLILTSLNNILSLFDSFWIWMIIACHILVIIFYWTPQTASIARHLAIPVWIVIFLHLVAITGPLKIPMFILFIILMVAGFVKEFRSVYNNQQNVNKQSKDTTTSSTSDNSTNTEAHTFVQSALIFLNKIISTCTEYISGKTNQSEAKASPKSDDKSNKALQSNMYLWSLVWACVMVQFYHHMWLLPFFAFPIWHFAIKHAGQYFGLWSWLQEQFQTIKTMLFNCFEERRDAVIPSPVRGILSLISKGDEKILNVVDKSLDTVVSLGIVILVLFCTLFAVIFFLVQIHAESMHMVQITSNLLNRTIVNNPQLQALLPDDLTEVVDSMFDNVYIYGREWSANMVKNLIGESDTNKALQIEKQVHEIVDKLYRIVDLEIEVYNHTTQSTDFNHTANQTDITHSWNKLVEGLSTPGLFDFTKISEMFKENIGTFLSVLDGVWNVGKGNISLVMNASTALLSVLLSGGTAILNFFVSSFVFFTALFYLLTTSRQQYKVAELIGRITPTGAGSRFGTAIESAITDVFTASFKMAVFYGMWTWLTHKLSGVRIVYLPSFVAAILGAVPLLGTYWAVLPAVLELWLIQDSEIKALAVFVCQLLPMSFVDSEIYSEITGGGGPYLTGLAIGAGIFCLGAEGAIIGPILLCCLYFMINMSSSLLQESPAKEQQTQPKTRQFRNFYSRTPSVS